MNAPLILTARFDAPAASIFQDWRNRHFPPQLNKVPAHLTLFHHLPGGEGRAIDAELKAAVEQQPPILFKTTGPRFLGRGVALEIEAPALVSIRRRLAREWQPWLTAQDGQGFRPHVTVQNKVAPAEARRLQDQLAATGASVAGRIVGLDLWHYRGGPWEHAARYDFPEDAPLIARIVPEA